MDAEIAALFLVGLLLQLLTPASAQPSMTIGFAEIDFEEVESAESINVTVTANGESSVDLTLMITPFTFDEYTSQFGRTLPAELQMRSQDLDRAEFDTSPGGRQDFPQRAYDLVIPASETTLRRDFFVSIPINNDMINEAREGFLILIKTSEETDNLPEAPIITYVNDGLTIGVIQDDDVISFSFGRPSYTVAESDGTLDNIILVRKNILTELDYSFNVSLRSGGIPATEGADFVFSEDLPLFFPSENDSAPVPITILPDDLVERTEDFRLALTSRNNVDFGPNIQTQVSILDEDVLKIGFTEESYMFSEESGSGTVCATILDLEGLDPSAFIIFTIYTIPGTAENPADYRGTTYDDAIANPITSGLNPNQLQSCITIPIVNDSLVEGSEQFQVSMVFSDLITNVNVEGCPANVTILDIPVNECEEGLDNCDPLALCVDLLNGFACICPTGYTGDGVTCDDIDECNEGQHNCHENAICINTIGSFKCECLPGFIGDGVNCEDIDECAEDRDNCHDNSTCINTIGSFECVCLPGFTGDGVVSCEAPAHTGTVNIIHPTTTPTTTTDSGGITPAPAHTGTVNIVHPTTTPTTTTDSGGITPVGGLTIALAVLVLLLISTGTVALAIWIYRHRKGKDKTQNDSKSGPVYDETSATTALPSVQPNPAYELTKEPQSSSSSNPRDHV